MYRVSTGRGYALGGDISRKYLDLRCWSNQRKLLIIVGRIYGGRSRRALTLSENNYRANEA